MINNAIKYSRSNKEVSIRIEENHMYSKVIIADSNLKIEISNINKIFDKFYRGNNATNLSGMGVGLYLTKNILTKQNGFVKYRYENGNVFELYFVK